MTSNQDILAFLKSEKETRAKEREEDMMKISEMIRVGVREEVKEALKPVDTRLGLQEQTTQTLASQVQTLMTEMTTLKEDVKNIADFPALPAPATTPTQSFSQPSAQSSGSDPFPSDESDRQKALDLLELCRRTVSLHPLQQADIDFESKRGAKDLTEAKLWAVQTFFRYEMNIKSHVLATFSIENIFSPEGQDMDTVYVTFSSITEANTVFSYTKNMRKEVTVGIFVPNEWKARFIALNNLAYKLRNPEPGQLKYSTRIKWGQSDLVLYRKEPGTKHWSLVNIQVPLPPVDMCAVGNTRMSPAPGRQFKRQRSQDSDSEVKKTRSVRHRPGAGSDSEEGEHGTEQGDGDSDNLGQAEHEHLHVVGGVAQPPEGQAQQDLGRVVGEESYCPASPAPLHKSKTLTSSIQESPIFKKTKSSAYRMNPLVL